VIETNVVPNLFYTLHASNEGPPRRPAGHDARPGTVGLRRYVCTLGGWFGFLSTEKSPAAVDYTRQVLEQIFEQHGVSLNLTGIEIRGPFE
jgi:hypothetical protein